MIRPARPSDFPFVVPLIIGAMKDVVRVFINDDDPGKALPLFEHFFKLRNNQYSYENTLVFVDAEDQICGSVTAYDGGLLDSYRKPFIDYLQDNYGLRDFDPGQETEAGEYYLDTVSVAPGRWGSGIGKELILAAIEHARTLEYERVGLIVDKKNPMAKKLYQRLGFQVIKDRLFMGGEYEHMQFVL